MKKLKTRFLLLTLIIIGLIISVGHGFTNQTAVLGAQENGNKIRINPTSYKITCWPTNTWKVYSNSWYVFLNCFTPTDKDIPKQNVEEPEQDKVEKPSLELEQPKEEPISEPEQSKVEGPVSTPEQPQTINLSYEQNRMFELINEERVKAGIKPLVFDTELANVANVKAQDMVDNNYFDHNSPTYGSPFDMMKNFGIRYYAAGENLAGYNNVDKAHVGLMNSDGHRKNILNPNFTHVGIGVCKSPKYGYVFVQMFIGK